MPTITRFHWRLIGWYLLGTFVVAVPVTLTTQSLLIGINAGALLGGLPGVILATNYTFGIWPFSQRHPVGADDE